MTEPASTLPTVDKLNERIADAIVSSMDLFSLYLGDQLGYYAALAEASPMTSTQLADATGTVERYAREWLEQQAVTGILTCSNPEAPYSERQFSLPEEYRSAFTDPNDPYTLPPLAQIFVGTVAPLQKVINAYRQGGGVDFSEFGQDMGEGQAGVNRPQFMHQLGQEWIPAMQDINDRLQAQPPARIADIGMGHGWSSIALANAYPQAIIDGFDLDAASVEAATANAAAAGVDDRVKFQFRDAGDPELAGQYDFALALECVHDMSNPVAVLAAMRRLVGPGGTVLIVDEKVADEFKPNGDFAERFFYGYSVLHCLPVGMFEQPSAETGAVMRTDVFRRYAEEAGYSDVEILPIEHMFFRFYRLTA